MSLGRHSHSAVKLVDGRVLVAGGFTGSAYTATAAIYNPATNAWAATGNMATARGSFSLSQLSSGFMLAAGGTNASGTALASAELYNHANGFFTPTPPAMPAARREHTAVPIGSGQIIVAGGNGGTTALASVVRYDSVENVWTSEDSLPSAKDEHRAVAFAGGILNTGEGGSETWGSSIRGADGMTGSELGATWISSTGTLASTASLTFRVTNHAPGSRDYTLRVVGRGLDDRESIRTLGSFTVGATANVHSLLVSELPIKTFGTPAYAEIRVEYAKGGDTIHATSEPLHHEFNSAYKTVSLLGASPKQLPGALTTYFPVASGALQVTQAALFSQIAAAAAPLFTLAGKIYDPPPINEYRDISQYAPKGGPAGTIKGSYPLDQRLSGIWRRFWPYTPPPAAHGSISYTLCATFNGGYIDSSLGEDVFVGKAIAARPAPYARYTIFYGQTPVKLGFLDANGCVSTSLLPNSDYAIVLDPAFQNPSGAKAEISYRFPWPTDWGGFIGLQMFPDGSSQKATLISNDLTLITTFRAGASGLLGISSFCEDQATRTAAIAAHVMALSDSGLEPTGYKFMANEGCGSDSSACADPNTATLRLGPFVDVTLDGAQRITHNTRWKNIVAHEFGHLIQFPGLGRLKPRSEEDYRGGDPGPPTKCNCKHILTPDDDKHCLGSQEGKNRAQEEGFGHFYAAKLWNDLELSDCSFAYYKASYATDGVTKDNPPARRACASSAVKYNFTHCDTSPTPSPNNGTEWDWLNFYTLAHRGVNGSSMADFRAIYRQACSGNPNGPPCNGHDMPFAAVRVAAQSVLSASQAEALAAAGVAAGLELP